ncbi:MAG: hypothetical protein KKF98_14925 [Bacteroidetes bacterium]|nr:hypothetical protein [Bacteroidota bacterium]
MNKINKLITTLFVLPFFFLLSCHKDEISPTQKAAFGKLEITHGDNQSGYFGEYLSDAIAIKASSNSVHRKYLIKWEMIQGNGSIEQGHYDYGKDFFVDSTGILEIKWRLGCDNNIQKVKMILYVDSARNEYNYLNYYSKPSDSLIISANGTKPIGWARSCGCDNLDSYSSKIVSYDNNTLYLVNQGLYSSKDDGLNWYEVEGVPELGNVVDAEFNSLGWLYILTRDNGICYTKDFISWQFINNGILDYRNPTTFFVDDTTLFVSFYFDGPYKTSNNGEFWRKLLVDTHGDRYYHINRHPNGDLYVFDKWDNFWHSTNNGENWVEIDLDYNFTNYKVEDFIIGIDGTLYIGSGDATISIVSSDTYTGTTHSFYEMNNSSQHVEDIQIVNDIVYFTVNGNPTPGIYSSQNWQRLELGFEGGISNYYLKKDGAFLILSNDGWYYYND